MFQVINLAPEKIPAVSVWFQVALLGFSSTKMGYDACASSLKLESAMIKWVWMTGLVAAMLISGIAVGESDQHESRRLMEQGEILPLRKILDHLGREHAGRVLEVELERLHGRYIYEIELLGEDGRVLEYEIDAASGEIINGKLEE